MADIVIYEGINELNVALTPVAATLYGRVTDADTGYPIEGVTVTIDGNPIYTDADGRYTFEEVDPGSYILAFMKLGYRAPDVQEVNLAAGDSLEINTTMSPLASYPISAAFPSSAMPGEEITVSHTVHLEYGSDYLYTVALELRGPETIRLAYVQFVSADLQALGGIFDDMLPMSGTGDYTFTNIAKLVKKFGTPWEGGPLPPGNYQVLSEAKLQVISEIKYDEYGRPYGLSYSAEGTIWEGKRMGWMTIGEVVPGVYNCIYCGATFSTEAELINHMETYHPDRPYFYNQALVWNETEGCYYVEFMLYMPPKDWVWTDVPYIRVAFCTLKPVWRNVWEWQIRAAYGFYGLGEFRYKLHGVGEFRYCGVRLDEPSPGCWPEPGAYPIYSTGGYAEGWEDLDTGLRIMIE